MAVPMVTPTIILNRVMRKVGLVINVEQLVIDIVLIADCARSLVHIVECLFTQDAVCSGIGKLIPAGQLPVCKSP
jgi:hypothetical protein